MTKENYPKHLDKIDLEITKSTETLHEINGGKA
jgi:hypothetical protein